MEKLSLRKANLASKFTTSGKEWHRERVPILKFKIFLSLSCLPGTMWALQSKGNEHYNVLGTLEVSLITKSESSRCSWSPVLGALCRASLFLQAFRFKGVVNTLRLM